MHFTNLTSDTNYAKTRKTVSVYERKRQKDRRTEKTDTDKVQTEKIRRNSLIL